VITKALTIAAVLVVAVANVNADFVGFGSDGWYQVKLDGTEGATASTDYLVIDIYAQFNDQESDGVSPTKATLLSLFHSDISMSDGRHFNHGDTDGGSWKPQSSLDLPSAGSHPGVDSFVLIGGSPGDLNNTEFDYNFDSSASGQVPTGGGWYTGVPAELQGRVDDDLRTWVGRFGIFNNDSIGESIKFSARASYNYGLGTGTFFGGSSSITVAIPDALIIPEPSALLLIGVGWAGLATIRKRFGGEPVCPQSLIARRRPPR
jgi:hypothetical protein